MKSPKQKAIHIKTDGSWTDVLPKNGQTFTLEELQGFVGGMIEIVSTKDGNLMIINEEGKLNGLKQNHKATDMYMYGSTDPIVGDVLIATSNYIN